MKLSKTKTINKTYKVKSNKSNKSKTINKTYKVKSNKSNKSKTYKVKTNKSIQNGGVKMGEGSFGCVVKPPILCNNNNNKYNNNNNYVSKLIPIYKDNDLEDVIEEIENNKVVLKIDKNSKYFVVALDWCYINPSSLKKETRDNITTRHMVNGEKNKKGYCNLDPAIKTVNLISPNVGYELFKVLYSRKYSETRKYLKLRFPSVIRHLLIGLRLLHKNEFTHLDIKPENMGVMITNKSAYIRYFDFGISINCKDIDISRESLRTVDYKMGTPSYMSPEMYVIHAIAKRRKEFTNTNYLFDSKIRKELVDNIYSELKKPSIVDYRSFKMTRDILDYPDVKEKGFMNYLTGSNDIIQYDDIIRLYNQIATLIHNNSLVENFYKPESGIIYKYDIFALGVSFFLMMDALEINSPKMKTLIRGMIDLNPIRRLSAKQCLYFLKEN